jgi:hypothetical protein
MTETAINSAAMIMSVTVGLNPVAAVICCCMPLNSAVPSRYVELLPVIWFKICVMVFNNFTPGARDDGGIDDLMAALEGIV